MVIRRLRASDTTEQMDAHGSCLALFAGGIEDGEDDLGTSGDGGLAPCYLV